MDFVLDQVIKKIDSVSAFVGVKSKEDLTLKPLVKKVKRKLVFLEVRVRRKDESTSSRALRGAK